jgi:hypothetical protein
MPRTEQKLTYTIFVGGQPVDKLTPEQIDRMAARIGEAMSMYYSNHPDEYQKIASKKKQTKS